MESALGQATVGLAQGILGIISALHITSPAYPSSSEIKDGASYDYIIVGGGTAGSIVANRLTENSDYSVLVIEAGEDPRIETRAAGLLSFLPNTEYDYNFPTVNDNFTAQNLKDNIVRATAGKALGGTSVLQHMIRVRGNRQDYHIWAEAAGDSSWEYDSLLPYFTKSENVMNEDIIKSDQAAFHGTQGNVGMTKEPHQENQDIIDAFTEMGLNLVVDLNGNITVGVTEPLFDIADNRRQSMAECYLTPAKDRSNLFVYKSTTVTKILFDDDNNAIGVEALTKNGDTVTIKAKKEVIMAAGVFKTPQLLMLSGVGPKSHLEEWDIEVISDLPVGQSLQDQVGALVVHKLGAGSILPSIPNFLQFPVPTVVSLKSLEPNSNFADYQTINLRMPGTFIGAPSLCSNAFKYKDEICNKVIRSNTGRDILFSVVYLMRPYSRGKVELRSKDPLDNPAIRTGFFTNITDLDNLGSYLLDFAAIVNTTSLKSFDAELVDFELEECKGMDKNSYDYWRCYGLSMSTSIWHPASTAPMGDVLDSRLNVRGVQRL